AATACRRARLADRRGGLSEPRAQANGHPKRGISMALKPGTKLGPYEVLSQIGAGGMGEVYKAHDTRLNRDVAIKVLPEHLALNADLRERFQREAETIANLNHPNICVLY